MNKSLHQDNFALQAQLITAFLGNSLENLFERLKINLFSKGGPFSKRIVVVPSRQMQEWISLQLLSKENLGIAAGIEFLFLKQSFETISHLFLEENIPPLPDDLALTLKIIEMLEKKEHLLMESLKKYLQKGKGRRKMLLAQKLASLFARYAIYFNENELQKWMLHPQHWQHLLWSECFENQKTYRQAIRDASLKKEIPHDLSIHFFGFSHIPSLYFDLFEKVSLPVCLYHFSPCQMFWSDHLTMKEKKRLFSFYKSKDKSPSSIEALEKYLEEENFLLANLGKVGREFAHLLDERNATLVECYTSYEIEQKKSLLKTLQQDILLLLKTPKESIEENCVSIEVHIHSSCHREIEGLKKSIADLLEKQDSMEPKDILVLAPDISLYEPFIKAHFSEFLPFKITDLPAASKNQLLGGFLHLLELPKKRWSRLAVLELFSNPLFQKKHSILSEHVTLLRKWIVELGIFWGLNPTSKKNALLCTPQSEIDASGTWESGLKKLFSLLIEWRKENLIDFSHIDFLGKLASLLSSLEDDLSPLYDSSELTLKEWALYFDAILQSYFDCSEDYEKLHRILEKVMHFSQEEKRYPFEVIFPLIENEFAKERITLFKSQLNAMTFSSIHPTHLFPAKVICFLGMDHQAFPRAEKAFSLDLFTRSNGEYFPYKQDFERFLFLESLFFCKEKMFFSYVGENPLDLTEIPPSTLLSELLQFTEEQYNVTIKQTKHPQYDFEAYKIEKANPSFFTYTEKKEEQTQEEQWISLKDLYLLSRSPLSYYFREKHGIYFKREENKIHKRDEPFILSPLVLAELRRDFLDNEEKIWQRHCLKGIIPSGNLRIYADYTLKKANREFLKNLEKLNIDPQSLFSLEMGSHEENPFCCSLNEKIPIFIHGKIEPLCQEGLISFDKKGIKGAILAWPAYLLMHCAANKEGSLFFVKDGKKCTPFLKDPHFHLKNFLEFALFAREFPCPLCPELIIPILEEDKKRIEALLKEHFFKNAFSHVDPALAFAFDNREMLQPSFLIEKFQKILQKTYSELVNAWF